MIRNLLNSTLTMAILIVTATASGQAPYDPADPLGGERMLLPSNEIMALRAEPVLTPRLYDALGDADIDGVIRTEVFTPPTGYRGEGYDFDGVAADFDHDGVDEFAYAYEAADGRAYLRIMETDEGPGGTVSGLYAAYEPMGGDLYDRQIRLVAGNMDADANLELVLAYQTWNGGTHLEFIEVDSATLEPSLVARFPDGDPVGHPNGESLCTGIWGGGIAKRRFDIALADLDGDQYDDLVHARLSHACGGGIGAYTSSVKVQLWIGSGGVPAYVGSMLIMGRSLSITDTNDFWDALAIAVGDFDGGQPNKQIAVVAKSIFSGRRELVAQFVAAPLATGLQVAFEDP